MVRFLLSLALTLTALVARADVAITEVTSPGGINAWLVEAHEIPFTALEISIKGGGNHRVPSYGLDNF